MVFYQLIIKSKDDEVLKKKKRGRPKGSKTKADITHYDIETKLVTIESPYYQAINKLTFEILSEIAKFKNIPVTDLLDTIIWHYFHTHKELIFELINNKNEREYIN
jgi:hypothetical protein